MKVRVSATIDKETNEIIDFLLKNKRYRNKSHIIETALEKLKQEEENNEKK